MNDTLRDMMNPFPPGHEFTPEENAATQVRKALLFSIADRLTELGDPNGDEAWVREMADEVSRPGQSAGVLSAAADLLSRVSPQDPLVQEAKSVLPVYGGPDARP